MDINGYPEFDCHYRLLGKIFDLINKLYNYGINIFILKIPSHCGIEENETVDAISNRAAQIAHGCKYGRSKFMKYQSFFNPVNIDIGIDLKRLHYKHRIERK